MCIRDSGTTTATVLAPSIVGVGLNNVTAGANPMDLKRCIDKAVAKVDVYKRQAYCLPILAKVREAGVRAEIYPDASKMKKQMGYALSLIHI